MCPKRSFIPLLTTVLLFLPKVYGQNQPPVAEQDIFGILVNQTLTTNLGQSLLNNDSDPEGTALLVRPRPVTDASSGTLTLNTDGAFSFSPVFVSFGATFSPRRLFQSNGIGLSFRGGSRR